MRSLLLQHHKLGPSQNSLSPIVVSCLFFTAAPIATGQELDSAGWLPKTLTKPYSESLATASTYVLSREGCDRLLEAKLSESTNSQNPKFILTCGDKNSETTNFVYWQSDIDSNFVHDSYPEKVQDKDEARALGKVEIQLKLRSDNHELIAACKLRLQDLLEEREIVLKDSDIEISQRGEQPVNVNLNYQIGNGPYAPKFSAICRRDSFDALNLRVFSTQ